MTIDFRPVDNFILFLLVLDQVPGVEFYGLILKGGPDDLHE